MFTEFNEEIIKAAILLGVEKQKFPGVTPEFLDDAIDWVSSEDGKAWLHEALQTWKDKVDEPDETCESDFAIEIVQTNQLNSECGLWFLHMCLVIHYELDGNWKWASLNSGEVFIKKTSGKVGKFSTNFKDVPCKAEIVSAKMVGELHHGEGLANGDHESVWEVRAGGEVIYTLKAADMHRDGWNKARPIGSFDVTTFAKGLRQ